MKKVLRSFLFIAFLGFTAGKSNAQCTVSDIVFQNITVIGSTPLTCTVKFDAVFNIENNNGNKFIFIHAWLQNDYPNYFHCVNGQTTINGSIAAPHGTDLIKSFINIGLDNNGLIPTVLSVYPPDASVQLATIESVRKELLPDGSANIFLTGVVVTAPVVCGTPVVIQADLWSSQSASAQRAHCVNCGIRYSAGYLNVTGLVNCLNLMYFGTISNNTSIPIDGYYRVFADVNGDGYFSPSVDTLLQTNTSFSVGANGSTSISGPIPGVNLNQDVFIIITQNTGTADGASRVFLLQSTQCAPLAVTFKSLKATRINQNHVVVNWETATETDNSGFAIQRNMGNNSWEIVSFIISQAPNGSSNSSLFYTFNDVNSNKGITQYRIKQVDLDGRAKFSEIRSVRGDAQKGKIIIYPNPSTNGRINVVFEEKDGIRDVTLSDMFGHTVRQWKRVTNNTLLIEKLGTGMYTLKVVVQKTGYISVEKIMVY